MKEARPSRRTLLGVAGALLGTGLGAWHKSAGLPAPSKLRPPGAGMEGDFLSACIRCGLCIQICPHDSLVSSGPDSWLSLGTPHVLAREQPCKLCEGQESDDMQCIDVCPTDALRPIDWWDEVRMGVAIIDRDICFAYNGTTCRACWHACPLPDQAITLNALMRPEVNADACLGCGMCTHACLTEKTSIPVVPLQDFVPGSPTHIGEGTA